jgi:CHASE3 domain sensor protein
MDFNKEIVLLFSLGAIIILGAAYWFWFSNNEYKKLIGRIKNMPFVVAIIAIFWNDEKS